MWATPRAAGYLMPAEWEDQAAVWLAWPHNEETWPGEVLTSARTCYRDVIRFLASDQTVRVLVNDGETLGAARCFLDEGGAYMERVELLQLATSDTWIRDYGPTFVVNRDTGDLAMVSWEFNAWGGKYADLLGDNGIPAALGARLDLRVFEAGIVLEGGSIEVNGRGLVLTTEQCLLNPNRNPGLGRGEIEGRLRDYLGVAEVVWLGEGIVGDDTDGHVDDVARFVDPDTVVCAREVDLRDENHPALEDNYQRLVRYRDRAGRALRVISLPMPGPVFDGEVRLPASYANFYVGNRTVVVPVFGDPNDERALEVLGDCFRGRRVVGVDSRALVVGLGAIHCCTQQQPRV